MSNNAAKNLLAKLLATENIVVQRKPKAKTASFDIKSRVLTLPVWQNVSEDLEDLLLGHETGHALNSPTSDEYKASVQRVASAIYGAKWTMKQAKAIHGFFNVIE